MGHELERVLGTLGQIGLDQREHRLVDPPQHVVDDAVGAAADPEDPPARGRVLEDQAEDRGGALGGEGHGLRLGGDEPVRDLERRPRGHRVDWGTACAASADTDRAPLRPR